MDAKDAKIVALTTKIDTLEIAFNTQSSSDAPKQGKQGKNGNFNLPEWRKTKRGDSITKEGETWWWYPHHKVEGQFDGLYMKHKPSEHDKWKEERDKKRKEYKDRRREKCDKDGKSSGNNNSSSSKLTLSDKLKSALMTRLDVTDDELSRFCEESK